MAVGTSFHGFFETKDGGKDVDRLFPSRSRPLKLGGGSYEEIAALAYDPTSPEPDLVLPRVRQGHVRLPQDGEDGGQRSIFRRTTNRSPLRSIAFNRHSPQDDWYLEARTDDARWARRFPRGWTTRRAPASQGHSARGS